MNRYRQCPVESLPDDDGLDAVGTELPRPMAGRRRIVTERSESKRTAGWFHPPPFILNAELVRPSAKRDLFANWCDPNGETGRIEHDEQVIRFKQLHFCAFRLSRLYQHGVRSGRSSLHAEYAEWVNRYHSIRRRLVDANLGLVYDLIKRTRFTYLDRDEFISEGLLALLRAVDTFDPWRGYRFSTYACNTLMRAFSRAAMRDSRRRSMFSVPFDPELEKSDRPMTQKADDDVLFIERLGEIMRENHADLSDTERVVLRHRFPDDADASRPTLGEIGRRMSISKERVRQIQHRALGKLRRAIELDPILQ